MFSWQGLALIIVLGALTLMSNADSSDLRPGVILSPDELARLRQEVKRDGWKRSIYLAEPGSKPLSLGSGIKTEADRWLDREIVIPGRSGHFHNFFCTDGNQLQVPADMKEHPEGYKCPACGKVYQGEKYDACIRWYVHNTLSRVAFALALTYAIEDDQRYAEKAVEILSKYADAYPGPHTSLTEGGMMYQSLCESVWSIPLAWAYDLVYDSPAVTPELRVKIESEFFRPIASGLRNMGLGGNWGSWHLSATGVIGYATGDQELIDYAITSFKSQIANQLGDDGLWPESVHTYHFYPLGAFLYLAEAAHNHGVDLYHWEAKPAKNLKAMFTAPLGYMYPDTRLAAINDGWFDVFLPLDQYELAYLRTGDERIGWALREGYAVRRANRSGLWAFLKGVPLVEAASKPRSEGHRGLEAAPTRESSKPEFRSTDYPVLGIATLRSDDRAMLTFDYGPYLGHGQPDKMGITLWAHGKLLVADYGTCGYGSPALAWYRCTPAHNTVVVDGKNQAATKERRLTCFEGDEVFEVAEAETEEAYSGVLHRRTIIRVDEYYVMIDRLESDSEHTYDWFLRSEGKLRMSLLPGGGPAPEYAFVEPVSAHQADGKWQARWDLGGQGLGLFMLDGDRYAVSTAMCPAEATSRKVPLIIARKSGNEATFTSVLYPYQGKLYVSCGLDRGLVKVMHDGVTDWIFIDRAEQGSPITTDGRFALVRVKDGEPVLTRVIGGEKVEWQGDHAP